MITCLFCFDIVQVYTDYIYILVETAKNSGNYTTQPRMIAQLHVGVCPTLGEIVPEKLGGGVRPASQKPYPIMTKICDVPYPIYDLTKNSNFHL